MVDCAAMARPTVWLVTIACVSCVAGPRGCGLAPSPPLPATQVIAGGVQTHLSRTGAQKLVAAAAPTLAFQGCISATSSAISYCDRADCAGGSIGCPIFVYVSSGQRPATPTPPPPFPPDAGNDDDGKDGITFAVLDAGSPGQVEVDVQFDVLVAGHLTAGFPLNVDCYVYGWSPHLADDTQAPLLATDVVTLGIEDGGVLRPGAGAVNVLPFSLTGGGCAGLGSELATVVNSYQAPVASFISDSIQVAVSNALNAAVPNPPGAQGALLLPGLMPYTAEHVDLEVQAIAGGYSRSGAGALDIGALAGFNSDADPSTRGPGAASEPAACAVGATVPDLSAAPYGLTFDADAGLFRLPFTPAVPAAAALSFDGGYDFAVGYSGQLLQLGAAHLSSSGAYCGTIGGGNLPALTTGELRVLSAATGTLFDGLHRPLLLSLSLDHATASIGFPDAGADHLDLTEQGLVLTAHLPDGAEAFDSHFDATLHLVLARSAQDARTLGLEPMLEQLDIAPNAASTDPNQLSTATAAFDRWAPTLDALALRQLAGAFGAVLPLPGNAALGTNEVLLTRARDGNTDWLIVAGRWGAAPDAGTPVDATASAPVLDLPDLKTLRALFDGSDAGQRPRVSFTAGPPGSEVSVRVDQGIWSTWRGAGSVDLDLEAWLIQGSHAIDVRARRRGEWASEGAPARLTVTIDSVPPEMGVAFDAPDAGYRADDPTNDTRELHVVAHDYVSADSQLRFAFGGDGGASTGFTADASVSVTTALALTGGGATALTLFAKDEAGNVGTLPLTLPIASGGSGGGGGTGTGGGGTQVKPGCGCDSTSLFGAWLALAAGLLRSRRHRSPRTR
jgi:hypothetical protein